jgi:lipoate-protein ligase A
MKAIMSQRHDETMEREGARGSGVDPAAQLAEEWSLFQAAESGACEIAWRCWQPCRPVVVLGRNGRAAAEVVGEACRTDGVDVLRRFTGGGSVVLAPGCLAYTVILPLAFRPEFEEVMASFRWILERIVEALGVPGLAVVGSDLVLKDRKVSGNAQRRGRRALIQHGTLLFDFDARLATRWLTEPVRQPSYRRHRPHDEFLGNLPLTADIIEQRLANCFR